MPSSGRMVCVTVNADQPQQPIDGFGVNINSQYWHQPWIRSAVEQLRTDLGATLYRVDIFGKSNWIDPTSTIGPESLDQERLTAIYQSEMAQRGWEMIRHLNAHGIAPYLTASGDVPTWMLGSDGKTLARYDEFCTMMVSLVDWAINNEGLKISYFGPLNETDIGSPEGPTVLPTEYVKVLDILDDQLNQRGLHALKLIVTEQAIFNTEYLEQIVRDERLAQRIGAFGMHCYAEYTPDQFRQVREVAATGPFAKCRLWMGEFGDLDQTGEREWYVAWWMASRLLDLLAGGFQAALSWDAFDNYHDHDESWTIFGLLRIGSRMYTAKKRYYALKQIYRFVPPGWSRIEASSDAPDLRVLAFASPDRTQLTIVGMNTSSDPAHLNAVIAGVPNEVLAGNVTYYRTSPHENCHVIGTIPMRSNFPWTGIAALVPPDSIFTLTTL